MVNIQRLPGRWSDGDTTASFYVVGLRLDIKDIITNFFNIKKPVWQYAIYQVFLLVRRICKIFIILTA